MNFLQAIVFWVGCCTIGYWTGWYLAWAWDKILSFKTPLDYWDWED